MDTQGIKQILEDNILAYWLTLRDPRGGFYGEVDGLGRVDADAPRGEILYARIIWAFSAAYRALGRPEYREAADEAERWFLGHFVDSENGGVYWSVTFDGKPLDTKKQLYSQGFAIYGLSEYVLATGDAGALEVAKALWRAVEAHFRDGENGGYVEALARDFSPLADMSLSAHDINADKTMNSHLHLLEAYAALYRVWPDAELKEAVHALLDIVCDRIMGPDGHLRLYFDRAWNVLPGGVSYGHDIETSWLALECARIIGDADLEAKVFRAAARMGAAGNEGLLPDGSMRYELLPDGSRDDSRQWWVQAEAVVGNLWLWKYHDQRKALERALQTWNYIQEHLVDREKGEWYWGVLPDGSPDVASPKAGFWKCPYHNTRMCLEALSILGPA